MRRTGVLFVCLGNICRSPVAEGVFRHKVMAAGLESRIHIDSAGTGTWHAGKPPDPRTIRTAAARGFDVSTLRARQVSATDLLQFDHVLAMDRSNHDALLRLSPPAHRHKIALFMEYAPHTGFREVPDPYYGDDSDFEQVLDLVEAAADGLLARLKGQLS
ncbi:MAG: low molecular weight protein-tyrosine-phosphatase [Pseudomonadota bacterium]